MRPPLPVLVVIALAFVASLLLAVAYPLVDPDEGRNAEVAREMAESGDLVIPHLAGMPYLDKPPGLFWAGALAIRLLGNTPLAVRLPAAIAASVTLVVLAWLALRVADQAFALRVLALTAVAPLFMILSAYVIFDMPLTACVTLVWTGLARELVSGPSPGGRIVMALALALGVLIKGPVMLAWAVGGSLTAALLLRRRDLLHWLGWWPVWLAVLALAGGWFLLATQRHPEYPRYAFLEESFERLTTGSFKREQPWWFVPAVLAGGAFPWSLVTPWLALRARRGENAAPPAAIPGGPIPARVALGFILFAAVFFTLSRSKLVTYLLPAIPALGWLAAAAWTRAGARARRWGFAAVVAVMPIAIVIGHVRLVAYARSQSGAPLAAAIAASGGGPVRYQSCYSPGTDFVLGRRATLAGVGGLEITSNYQHRYRDTLVARGMWTPRDPAGDGEPVSEAVVVRPAARAGEPPAGGVEIFRDRRFAAFRRSTPR